MSKKVVSLLFVGIFLFLCLVPSVGLLLTGGAEAGANEVLSSKPSLTRRDGSFNPDVLADLGDYVDDRFSLRQQCVTAWAGLNAALFRVSVTDSVVLGSGGWLYYEPTLADYTRAAPMTDRELWCAGRTLYLLQEYAESRGAEFLFTVAPNKNSLYDEHMPARTRLAGLSNAEALEAVLEEMGVNYVNLFDAFRGTEETLYFRTDSHWNGKGAALAADTILAALGRESRFYDGTYKPHRHRGDLYEMLYPAGRRTEEDYFYAPMFTFTASSANADSITLTTECPVGTGALLCYRDSFGRNLYPYLAESFGSAVFSRKNDYAPGEVAAGDVMAVELVERNLRYLNTYVPTFPAPERPAPLVSGAGEYRFEAEITLAKSALAGYTVLRGDYGGLTPENDSRVFVSAAGTLYEATPGPEGFSLCLPEDAAAGPVRVYFTWNRELIALDAVIKP